MPRDADRLARASRALRGEAGLRQVDLVRPGRSLHFVRALEAGRLDDLTIGDARAHFRELDARLHVSIFKDGADLDRLLDRDHAQVVERGVGALATYGWPSVTEVTFSEYGERGSIDIFAAHPELLAVFVGEAKSAWGSIEETNRSLDAKARLAPKVTLDRFGWRPRFVAKVLLFPDDSTARRIASRYQGTLNATYPARAREIRSWLRRPDGNLAGIWFLSNVR